MAKRTNVIIIDAESSSKKALNAFRKKNADKAIFTVTCSMDGEDEDGDEAEYSGEYLVACDPSTKMPALKKATIKAVQADVGDDYSNVAVSELENVHMPAEEDEEETPKPKRKKAKKGTKKGKASKSKKKSNSDEDDDEEPAPKKKAKKASKGKGKKSSGKKAKKSKKDDAEPKQKTASPAAICKAIAAHIKEQELAPNDAWNFLASTDQWKAELSGLKITRGAISKTTDSPAYTKLLRRLAIALLADVAHVVAGFRTKAPAKALGTSLFELLDRAYVVMSNAEDAEDALDLDEVVEELNGIIEVEDEEQEEDEDTEADEDEDTESDDGDEDSEDEDEDELEEDDE